MIDRERLQRLLRVRGESLQVPAEIIDRALARCARLEVRAQRNGTSTRASLARIAASATVPSLGAAPPPEPAATEPDATVPSLGDAPAPPPRSGGLAPGRIIAGYRIESLLGKGGMGAVYRAVQLSMARPVAFKVLAPRLAGDPTFVGRFKREARAAGRLHHPNLITVHEAGEAAGVVFFSMELVEGRSLKEVLRQGPVAPVLAVTVARQVLEALRFAHGKGVIHRDIKPDNIMLGASGQVKIADLGLSRIEEQHPGETTEMFKTAAGSFMGTPHYMAPEQCRDAHAADNRADLYALGATLYHLLCGKPPFDGVTPMEVMVAAQQQPLTFPEPGPPKPLREFIRALMEKDPARRPADAGAALALLDRLAPPPAPAAAGRRRPWWRRLLRALAWVLAVGIGVALILGALQRIDRNDQQRAWLAALAAANSEAEAMQWHEALTRLAAARPGLPAELAAQCDAASGRITTAWDAWALDKFASSAKRALDHLDGSRFQEAFDVLKQVPAAWRSPAVERRIDDLMIQIGEAAARAAEQKHDGDRPEEPKRDGDRPPELMRLLRQSAEIWQRAAITPATSARMDNGVEILSGSGSARLALPAVERTSLRLIWRGQREPAAELTVDLGGGAQAVFTPAGATLQIDGRSLPLGHALEGQALRLSRGEGGWFAEVRGPNGPTAVRVALAGELTLRWKLGGAELAAFIGGLKR